MIRLRPALLALLAVACGGPAGPPGGLPTPVPGPPAGRPDDRVAGATATPGHPDADPLPDIPPVDGPLSIRVIHPRQDDIVAAGDSSFIFGSLGTGRAALRINGQPVRVWPNGAWLGWIAFPQDSVMRFAIEATRAGEVARLIHLVRRTRRFVPPGRPAWVDSGSMHPAGRVWWPADEPLRLSVRAAEGAIVRLRLPDGTHLPLAPDPGPERVAEGVQAFDADPGASDRPVRADRYAVALLPRRLGRHPGPLVGDSGAAGPAEPGGADSLALLEVVRDGDTARAAWPLRLAPLEAPLQVVELHHDPTAPAGADGITVGRAAPGATYHWFFPGGTVAAVDARINGDIRLRLSEGSRSWVAVADARLLAPGTPAPRGVVGSISPGVTPGGVRFRVPVGVRVPFRIVEEERRLVLRLHGAVGDVNWIRHGATDGVVTAIRWDQVAADEVELTFDLREPVWGYRTSWDRGDLLLEVRRPPEINRSHPLRGLLVAVDPGHPPGGATGPTGLREAEANLGIALELRDQLTEAGARVLLTRTSDSALGLRERTAMAEGAGADLLVSIHNNALPDGVDPFRNNGTSVFYNQPRSRPLAREVQRALVRELGLRDLGHARGDLALVRPTWMPAILTEGLFLMVPDQEHALRTVEVRRRHARAVRQGLERFLRDRASND